jgi:hypothetical protein
MPDPFDVIPFGVCALIPFPHQVRVFLRCHVNSLTVAQYPDVTGSLGWASGVVPSSHIHLRLLPHHSPAFRTHPQRLIPASYRQLDHLLRDLHSATSQLRSRASSLSGLPRWQDEFPTNYPSRTAAAWSVHRVFAFFIRRRQRFVRRYGAAGCVEENWSNLSLEDTSSLSHPLGKDMSDAVLVGLEFDLTSTELFRYTSASMEGVHSLLLFIMYAYGSDGTLTG